MGEVLYDMRTPGAGLLSFPMPLLLLAIAVVMVVGLVKKETRAQRDVFLGKGRYVLMLGIIAIALGAAMVPQALRPWAAAPTRRRLSLRAASPTSSA